ncbi:MAG: KpsF/GutQ family sugar-phosphate isomerase [Verrucomicrobia bacterium]|nr:KpsF/GutQ family sugar-phosphate isomerase [Verrucomicrobiota bacterium]
MNYLERARRVLTIETEELQRLSERLDHRFDQAIELMRTTIDRRNKIIVLGVGKSGHIGEKIAATLTSTGAPAVVLNSLNALHGDLGVVADGDLFLILSYSGETDEILTLLPILARFDAKRIALTGNKNSTLAKACDIFLDVHVAQEACPHNLAPTSSTTTMLALGDALAMVLLEARGFTRENFARFHPGGQLGRSLLVRARDIMQRGEEVVMVSPETLVMDVLKQLIAKRSGAAIVVTSERSLAGIFTHGDFVRHFANNPNIGQEPVGKLMTRQPITIHADKLAGEVLVILEQHRIDDLIVIDEDGTPLGMIDSQDLSRLKIL